MQLKQSIAEDYSVMKDGPFLLMTQNLANNLETSRDYPAPTPTVVEYRVLIGNFEKGMQLLETRVKGAKEVRDYARHQLEVATTKWSEYAKETTPDRPDLWGIAGFPLTKAEASRPVPPGKGQNLRVSDGLEASSLHAEIDRVPGMLGYIWRIWPEGTTPGLFGYYTLVTREPEVDIPGLTSRQTYCVQGAPWNNTEDPHFSDAVTRTVQ